MSEQKSYLVVVEHPTTSRSEAASAFTVATPPTVKIVRAWNAEKAAEIAGVRPGGRARVVLMEHVMEFKRPKVAALEIVNAS